MATRAAPRTARPRAAHRRPLLPQIWAARWYYLFMAPALVLAVLFTLYPIVASWYYSFLDWSGFTSQQTWIGLANYRETLHDTYFWGAFKRSFLFMFASVPPRLILALLVALLLNDRALKLAPIFRTFFFIPVVTTAAIVGVVMTFLFSPFNGPIDKALLAVHLIDRPIDFLGNPDTALWTVVVVFIWKNFGITMIYWLAALQTIPAELYEAATVDGAGRWVIFRRITLPLLTPLQTLRVFPIVQTMTGGGPFFASEVMEVYIYRTAFGTGGIPRLGYASAVAVVFGLSTMVIAIGQGWALQRARAATRAIEAAGGEVQS